MIEQYIIHLAILIGIHLLLTLSLQLTVGYTGLLNLGHIAFYGVGAYVSALMAVAGYPFWLCIIAAALSSFIVGVLLTLPVAKLKGDYFALATMGFSFVVYAVFLNWQSVTRGPLGIPGIPRPELFGFVLRSNLSYLIFTFVIVGLVYWFLHRLLNAPFGKVLEAIRDDEVAVQSLGKPVLKMKCLSMGISAAIAGIGGCLYSYYISFIDPTSFTLLQLIPILSMIIIGGLGSLWGTVLATVLLVLLPEPLRFIDFPSAVIGPMRQILYGGLLLLILLYRPKGFLGRVKLVT